MDRAAEQGFVFSTLLLAAQLALSVVARILADDWRLDGTQELLLVALPLSQLGLTALWAAIGSAPARARWGALAAVIGFWTCQLESIENVNRLLFGLLVAQATVVFLIAAALRLASQRLALVASKVDEAETCFSGSRRQFGLGRLLIGIGWLAAVLATARGVDFAPRPLAMIAAQGVVTAIIAWGALRAVLVPAASWRRAASLVGASFLAGGAIFWCFSPHVIYWLSGVGSWQVSAPLFPPRPGIELVLYGAVQQAGLAILLLAWLWVFRLCGYRCHVRRPVKAS